MDNLFILNKVMAEVLSKVERMCQLVMTAIIKSQLVCKIKSNDLIISNYEVSSSSCICSVSDSDFKK